MTRYFLTRVSLEGFRGVNNEGAPLVLNFTPDRVNSVFAPNGSGKSSLFEALQYAFKGRVDRLEGMQISENPDDYVANLFHSQRRATIELTLQPDDNGAPVSVRIERDATGARRVSSPTIPDPERLLASLNEDFALLDYAAFNRFIEDTALTRGRSFSSLLGLSEYGEFLRSLKTAANTQAFKTDFGIPELETEQRSFSSQAERALQEFSVRYQTITNRAFESDSLDHEWGRDIVESLHGVAILAPLIGDTAELTDVNFELLKGKVLAAENGVMRDRLSDLVRERDTMAALASSSIAGEASAEIVSKFELLFDARAAATEANLQKLLVAASEFLHLHEEHSGVCPLCERDGADGLAEHVDKRLRKLEDLQLCEKSVRDEVLDGAFVARMSDLEQVIPALDGLPSVAAQLKTSVRSGISLTADLIEAGKCRLVMLEDLLTVRREAIATEMHDIESSLPPSLVQLVEQIAASEAALSDLTRYRQAKTGAARIDEKLRLFEEWKNFVDLAHRSFADAEAKMSQRILGELRSDYQQFFKSIMSVGDIIPTLTRSQSSEQLSVELSSFHGAPSVPARAVLSESYRNALAISVFLSAAARHGKSPRFVVLDDVTSSFDAGHQFRLMEQLRTTLQYNGSNGGLQVVLLSHDVTLEKYFDRLDDGASWHHQKLQGWPPLTPVTAHSQNTDRLRVEAERYLLAGQVPEGAGLIRQYLEFVVQQVIRKVQIPVPIDLAVNDHAKMVGACLDAIVDAVNVRQAAGTIVLEGAQISDLTGRHVPAIVANWVSHYGTAGSAGFSPASLLGVLEDIDALRQCFQFDTSGTRDWRFYKSLTRRT